MEAAASQDGAEGQVGEDVMEDGRAVVQQGAEATRALGANGVVSDQLDGGQWSPTEHGSLPRG